MFYDSGSFKYGYLQDFSTALTEYAKLNGYASIISDDSFTEVVVFYTDQVKSIDATEFNPNSNKIYESVALDYSGEYSNLTDFLTEHDDMLQKYITKYNLEKEADELYDEKSDGHIMNFV